MPPPLPACREEMIGDLTWAWMQVLPAGGALENESLQRGRFWLIFVALQEDFRGKLGAD